MQIPCTCYPHSKIEEDSYDWWERHWLKQRQAAEQPYDIVFIGDSITHFWHDEQGMTSPNEAVWQEFYGRRPVLNLGYGYDRPQNVLYRLDHGEFPQQPPKVVVLNIGTNCFSITRRYDGDSPEIAFEGVKAVVRRIFELASDCRLILMELFPRLPEATQAKIDRVNELLREFGKSDPRIAVLSIADKLTINGVLNPALYRDAACHPNEKGYRLWAEALEPYFEGAL